MLFVDDEDESLKLEPEQLAGFLHGVWRDEADGSTIYVDGRASRLWAAYCAGGDSECSDYYQFWELRRGQIYAHFTREWCDCFVVLQVESQDSMVGGWWNKDDIPKRGLARLPFVPGVHPCRWVRQDPRRPWPEWAVTALNLPTDGSVSTESLAAELAKRTSVSRVAPERTSQGRYHQRIALWTAGRERLARVAASLEHRAWWLLHNLVAHPLLAVVQRPRTVALHDWTSRRLNRDDGLAASTIPRPERRLWWILHNLVAHPAIGLVPCGITFRWHDITARRMRVAGWI